LEREGKEKSKFHPAAVFIILFFLSLSHSLWLNRRLVGKREEENNYKDCHVAGTIQELLMTR
jgi:hypothetical protein